MRLGLERAGRCAAAWLLGSVLAVAATAAAGDGAAAGSGVKQLHRGTPHDALFDITFEGAQGIAVGAFGTVLASNDGGARWERLQTPASPKLALLAVARQGGRCIAVGQSGSVLTSDDCKAWQAVVPISKARLLAVAVNAQGVAYAVGGFGTLLRSADWGKSWAVQTVDWKAFTPDGAEPHLYGVHVAKDGTPTVVGEFELILRANPAGAQWKALHKGERSLFALAVQEDGRAFAVGQSGAVLASSDGGATWRALSSGTEAILTGVHAAPKGPLLASGINTVLVSKDDGASWARLASKELANGRHQALATGTAEGGKTRWLVVGSGGSILELNP